VRSWRDDTAAHGAENDGVSETLRVVTQNLWGRRGAWADRRSVLSDGLRELQPDLVALSETIANDEYDQVMDVLGPGFHVAHQTEREPGDGVDVEPGQGFSIASRWPLGEVRELDLHLTPRTEGFACGTLIVEVLAPEPFGPLLFGYHNPNWQLDLEHERELQAVAAARFIDELVGGRDPHVVLTADLDADPETASVRFWSGRQALNGTSVCYRDAWESAHPDDPGHTFTPANPLVVDWDWPFRRIDYIFVRCGEHGGPTLEIKRCERIFDEPVDGIWASDHFGVVADLAVPRR
jgi:endonuclease/exonuclease/phosphatase family metal-dependent hydrolase